MKSNWPFIMHRRNRNFRFIDWDNFSAESVTLPIDKVAAQLVKEKF